MAYHESISLKIGKLLKNPKHNAGKILPFLKSKIEPYKRDLYEFLKIESLSKPYPGHEKLLQYINFRNGFFVECGANDGYFQDPTYYLEKFNGWNGILVEPLPIWKLCKRNRKKSNVYNFALVSIHDKRKTVDFIDCNAMSFIEGSIENRDEWINAGEKTQQIEARKITVPARTIQNIIDEHTHTASPFSKIDLLVIDVEGFELEVIKGLDFKKNPPSFILTEAHTEEKLSALKTFLSPLGYKYLDEIGPKDYLFEFKINY